MKTEMKVRLLEYTPNPEKIVATAAKLCYSNSEIENIEEGLNAEKVSKFLDMLVDLGHESPIEHVNFTFGIEGVSRSLTHQLVRHRIASYSQKSQRYVNEGQFEYVVPPEIENNKEACERFITAMESAQNYYNEVAEILTQKHTESFISAGMEEKKARSAARKKANEDARFILPNACETKIIVTMNARGLMNFFRHRCCNRAQWEIRELAEKMFALVYKVAPIIFKNAGPACINGRCPEGRMSCGKMREMVDKYNNLRSNK